MQMETGLFRSCKVSRDVIRKKSMSTVVGNRNLPVKGFATHHAFFEIQYYTVLSQDHETE